MRKERASVNINISQFQSNNQHGRTQEEIDGEESEDSGKRGRVRHFDDVPTIDFMKNGVQAVMQSYSAKMRKTIGNQLSESVTNDADDAKT